jgi:hypothetical protein
MLIGALFKIKENKLETWKSWELFLMQNKSQVVDTLIEEKMLMEGSMTFEIEKENYVILFGYHEEPLLPTTEKEINIKHKATKKECLEYVGKINPGYFVEQ